MFSDGVAGLKLFAVMIAAGLVATGVSAQPQLATNAGPFMLFFDWDKGEVRRDEEALLDQVAEAWRARPGARLRLTGHTDRSGSASFNRRTGLERAETVRSALGKRGIPRNAMNLVSFGEDQPLVPTDDGVREVQNRRVEIMFEE